MLRIIEEGPVRVSWRSALAVVRWLVVILIPVAIGVAYWGLQSGVEVILVNHNPAPLRNVVIHVTGASYRIGDLPFDQTVRLRVHTTGESHLEIEFKNSSNKLQREIVDCYFESNDSGSIKVDFFNGDLRIEDHIKPSKWD